MKFVAVTSCPTGIAHTYMAADALKMAAERAGVALNLLTLGVSMHPDPEVRACDTLDWYAPKFMSRHTLEEVLGWFREAGLVDVEDLSAGQTFFHEGQGNGVNVRGRRPESGRRESP